MVDSTGAIITGGELYSLLKLETEEQGSEIAVETSLAILYISMDGKNHSAVAAAGALHLLRTWQT